MLRALLLAGVVALGAQPALAIPVYSPVGPQNDVAVADVLGAGWSIAYSGAYADTADYDALFSGISSGDWIMLAARQTGSSTFDVLAAISADVFLPMWTGHNETVLSNGAEWYKNDYSLGFAGAGDAIFQSTADTNGTEERDRLSWHTSGSDVLSMSVEGGWRSGDVTGLNGSTDWERLVLTTADISAPSAAVPLPAALPLLGAALLGLGVAARRRAA